MSPTPPDRRPAAERWLRWAAEDLLLARHVGADPELVPRGACSWSQQAAEKALKAVLIALDIDPPKSHDLDHLVGRIRRAGVAWTLDVELVDLTRWSIEGRYPDDLDEANATDAERAIAVADAVVTRASALVVEVVGS